jgi:uncharacterized protein (DUF1778 family)
MLQAYKTVPLRFAEDDHKKVVEAAKKEGLTLEKFILLSISEKMERQEGE